MICPCEIFVVCANLASTTMIDFLAKWVRLLTHVDVAESYPKAYSMIAERSKL